MMLGFVEHFTNEDPMEEILLESGAPKSFFLQYPDVRNIRSVLFYAITFCGISNTSKQFTTGYYIHHK